MLKANPNVPIRIQAYIASSMLFPPIQLFLLPFFSKSVMEFVSAMVVALMTSIIWFLQLNSATLDFMSYLSAFVLVVGIHSIQWIDVEIENVPAKFILNGLTLSNIYLAVKNLFPASIERPDVVLGFLMAIALLQSLRAAFGCSNIYSKIFIKGESTNGGEYIFANLILLVVLLAIGPAA